MSVFVYNGISLPYATSTRFEKKAVGDDQGDTDQTLVRYDIQVQCVINTAYIDVIYPNLAGQGAVNPADIMNAIEKRLMQRRKPFKYTFNGVDLIPHIPNVLGKVDAANGPIPQAVNIIELNNTTFFLTYHIVAHYVANRDLQRIDNPGSPVIYNRWEESIDMDDLSLTRRTRQGKMKIRSDNSDGFIADRFRLDMAIVGVPPGFLRKRSHYKVSPDGLALEYSLTDEEQFKMPPTPAFHAEGEYSETSTVGGAVRYGEVYVRLKGAKTVDQALLVDKAMAICAKKLAVVGAPISLVPLTVTIDGVVKFIPRGIVQSASLRIKMYENEVEARMRVMFHTSVPRVASIPMLRNTLCRTPGSDPADAPTRPPYKLRGTASLLLQAAAYYDPTLLGVKIDLQTGQLTQGKEVGTAGLTAE